MRQINETLRFAYDCIEAGSPDLGLAYLYDALSLAQYHLPSDVPRNRCLRAYIVQAIGALNENP